MIDHIYVVHHIDNSHDHILDTDKSIWLNLACFLKMLL